MIANDCIAIVLLAVYWIPNEFATLGIAWMLVTKHLPPYLLM